MDNGNSQLIEIILDQIERSRKSFIMMQSNLPIKELEIVVLRLQQISFASLAKLLEQRINELEK